MTRRKSSNTRAGSSLRNKRAKYGVVDADASDREDVSSTGEDSEKENEEVEEVATTANVGTTNAAVATTTTVTPSRPSRTNEKDTSELTNPTGLTTKSSSKSNVSYSRKPMTKAEEAYRRQLNKLECVIRRVVNTEVYVNHKFIDLDFHFCNARPFVEAAMVTENIPVPGGVERADFVENLGQMMVKFATLNKNHIQRNMKKQYWGKWTAVCVL
jgi:hypothetical protein